MRIIIQFPTNSEMCIDTDKPSSPNQAFVVPIRDVFPSFLIFESLCKPEINYVNYVGKFPPSNQKILRLDISVEVIFRVQVFHPLQLEQIVWTKFK